jgi:hypothetical protein
MLRIARTAICGCPVAAMKTVAWSWIIDPDVRGAHR